MLVVVARVAGEGQMRSCQRSSAVEYGRWSACQRSSLFLGSVSPLRPLSARMTPAAVQMMMLLLLLLHRRSSEVCSTQTRSYYSYTYSRNRASFKIQAFRALAQPWNVLTIAVVGLSVCVCRVSYPSGYPRRAKTVVFRLSCTQLAGQKFYCKSTVALYSVHSMPFGLQATSYQEPHIKKLQIP